MSQALEKIAAEVRMTGPITFARFMELALYCPVCGYYEAEKDTIGRRGDYYTSVSVGSLFGELLALQMADWLEAEEAPAKSSADDPSPPVCQVVEGGAHNGQLARDILRWIRSFRPKLFEHMEYWIIEPSRRRRAWQRESVAEFSDKVQWAERLAEFGSLAGIEEPRIIFANELLDAMPVHRFAWDARQQSWFEWGVTLRGSEPAWTRLPVPEPLAAMIRQRCPGELSAVLPDGYIVEISPAAESWWTMAASVLRRGKLLALDYGLTGDELLTPERAGGTLRAYRSQRAVPDILADPGEQDLTAHVNFSAIQEAGETAGLATESFGSQEQFLTRIASRTWNGEAHFGQWTPGRARQFKTLTHPQHLGRAFRILVQHRSGR